VTELYSLAPAVRILFVALLAVAIALQTARLLLMVSHKQYRVPRSLILFEIFMLLHLVLAVMLLAMTLLQRNIPAGYFFGFRFIDLVPIIQGVWIIFMHRKPEPLLCSLLLLATLPFYSLPYSEYIYLSVNMYFICRSMVMLDMEWRRIRKSVTRLSIKEAVDFFPGGILYAKERGRTLIANPTMNRLLDALNINAASDALSLWETLMKLQDSYNVGVQALEDKLLIRIRNAGSWLFSNQTIFVHKKKYIQLLAIDITDEDILTREMEEANHALEEIGRELSSSLKNIEQLEKEREILRMKARVHDILGQRLSILSRLLESDMETIDIVKGFKPLLTDLTRAITENADTSPEYLLSSLNQSFALIGTAIHMKGALPPDQKAAMAFAEIIRECATNAVRHADAKNVYIELTETENKYMLLVGNDGSPPSEPIIEGSGIAGMRRQIHELSGEFTIGLSPRFQINMHVPKGRKDDSYD
jgi:signal transduction histidine kinase